MKNKELVIAILLICLFGVFVTFRVRDLVEDRAEGGFAQEQAASGGAGKEEGEPYGEEAAGQEPKAAKSKEALREDGAPVQSEGTEAGETVNTPPRMFLTEAASGEGQEKGQALTSGGEESGAKAQTGAVSDSAADKSEKSQGQQTGQKAESAGGAEALAEAAVPQAQEETKAAKESGSQAREKGAASAKKKRDSRTAKTGNTLEDEEEPGTAGEKAPLALGSDGLAEESAAGGFAAREEEKKEAEPDSDLAEAAVLDETEGAAGTGASRAQGGKTGTLAGGAFGTGRKSQAEQAETGSLLKEGEKREAASGGEKETEGQTGRAAGGQSFGRDEDSQEASGRAVGAGTDVQKKALSVPESAGGKTGQGGEGQETLEKGKQAGISLSEVGRAMFRSRAAVSAGNGSSSDGAGAPKEPAEEDAGQEEGSQAPASPLSSQPPAEEEKEMTAQAYRQAFDELAAQIERFKREKTDTSTWSYLNMADYELRCWDDKLNELYEDIIGRMDEEDAGKLREEERDWIKKKDEDAKKAAARYKGGTLEGLEHTASLAGSTKKRAYELLEDYGSVLPQEEPGQDGEAQ